MSKKKDNQKERNQKRAERKKTVEEERARNKKQARKATAIESMVIRVNHKTPDSPVPKKPAQKIVPVTRTTEKALKKWSENVGNVGTTNTVTPSKRESPRLITVVFSLMDYGQRHSTLIVYSARGEKVYGLIPNNKGFIPQAGIRYLCEEPWPGQKPLFSLHNRFVYTVNVYPLIVKQINERVISLMLVDPEVTITEDIMSQSTFGKDVVLYISGSESKCVWIEKAIFVRKIKTMLEEAELTAQGTKNSWKQEGSNLLIAPVYAIKPNKVGQIIAEAIQQKEEKLLLKNNKH